MKILYVLERYPELSQTFVAQELIGLQELGAGLAVAALDRGIGGAEPVPATYTRDSGPIARASAAARLLAASPGAVGTQLTRERSWPPPGGTRRIRGLGRLAPLAPAAAAADHIHAHFATEATDIARLLSRLTGTPFSFTAHAADAYGPVDALAVNLEEAAFARACSEHVADRLADANANASDRIVRLGVAIDFARFHSGARRYNPTGPVVAVGRLVEKKGFPELVEGCARALPSLAGRRLRIIGEGPMRDQLETLIESTGAPVDLLGALPNEAVAEELTRASLFALTPRTARDGDRDGRPAAIAEAMASGLPILSTSQPGIPELVTRDCGALARPGDPESIARALSSLFALSGTEREAMGRAGSARAEALHSRQRVALALRDLFAGATAG